MTNASSKKKRVVVVCPGRGSYTKETLGYLKPYKESLRSFLGDLDTRRQQLGEPTISELDDASVFKTSTHTKGEHASTLIYACSYADYVSLDRKQYEVVAITGNSMGWYTALALGGALDWGNAFSVINTMGSMMKSGLIGGQMIYPLVNEDWSWNFERERFVKETLADINLNPESKAYISIALGGFIVLAGNETGLFELKRRLSAVDHYPFQLINHGAFHTPLLEDVSRRAFEIFSPSMFNRPSTPLIDGRGKIWLPWTSDKNALFDYTLGHQVVEPYNFTAAITVALKEFNPDHLILLGPGESIGGAIGQVLVKNRWSGINNKAEFSKRQRQVPYLLAMGRSEQRSQMELIEPRV